MEYAMIPVLYASTDTTAQFSTNGLGRLGDVISCIVEEERNGKFELEMEYPVGGVHFDEIAISRIVLAAPADGKSPQPFRIYSITKPINGKVTIYAEHISYQLSHIPVSPFGPETAAASALQGLKAHAAEACPFDFWTDKTSSGSFTVKEPASIRALLGGTQGSILDAFGGGEYEWDGYTVKLYLNRGTDSGVTLRYGKNITNIEQEENIENTITGVYPYWKGDVDGEETLVTMTEKVLHHASAANYPYQRTATLDCSSAFQEAPTEAQLRSYATSYMQNNGIGVPKINIKVEFLPLWQTEEYKDIANLERVRLCDTVTVIFEKLGITATAKVVKTRYDVLKDRYAEIELGEARTKLADAVKSDIKAELDASVARYKQMIDNARSFLQAELESLEQIISSANDGNIVFTYDANGNRTQILAMDTQDIQTADKVLLINYAGIGGYSGGYGSQNFKVGITTDGSVVAESIAAGTIKAALLMGNVFKVGGSGAFGDGVIEVYNSNDVLIGKWDKNGLHASGDLSLVNGTIEGFIGPCKYPDYSQTEGTVRWLSANGFLVQRKENGITRSSHSNILGQTNEWAVDYAQGAITDYKIISTAVSSTGAETDGVVYRKRYGTGYFELDSFKYGSATDPGISLYLGGSGIAIEAPNLARILAERTTFSSSYTDQVTLQKGGAILTVSKASYESSPTGKIGDGTIQIVSSSSRRYKHSIRPIEAPDLDPHRLLDLPVVQFEWNDDHTLQYQDMRGQTIPGIIAEEVDQIYPAATIHHPDTGQVESWDERRIIPGMLALIQEQDKKIRELEARLRKVEEMLNE